MADTLRAFVAVELADETRAVIRKVEGVLQAAPVARAVKWVDPAQMHITVKFLGETPVAKLDALRAALDRVGAAHAPFALHLAGLGTFPGGQRVRVVWIGLDQGVAPLVALTNDAETALTALGFAPERHDPSPHVTLGRVRDHATLDERRQLGDILRGLRVPEFPVVQVDHLSLMRSHLSPQGARYERLHAAALASPAL